MLCTQWSFHFTIFTFHQFVLEVVCVCVCTQLIQSYTYYKNEFTNIYIFFFSYVGCVIKKAPDAVIVDVKIDTL